LKKDEAPCVLIFLGERLIGLQKLVNLHQAVFLKEVRMEQYYKMWVNILEEHYF
jgi:hypothetical protein